MLDAGGDGKDTNKDAVMRKGGVNNKGSVDRECGEDRSGGLVEWQ